MAGTELKLSFHDRIGAIDADRWDALHDGHPFLRHAFLDALETSGCASAETGWLPHHITITDDEDRLSGAMPLYLKGHSFGEYVFDHSWAEAYEQAGGRYYPKLQSAIPFTPVTGQRLLVDRDTDHDMIGSRLLKAGRALAENNGLSGFHLTFLTERDMALAQSCGFLLRTDQQFHWLNDGYGSFDDFLGTLSSRKRKQIRKERRQAYMSGVTIRYLKGKDINETHWDSFFAFYLDTGSRKWGRPYLNRDFFSLIGQTMSDSIMLVMCEKDGKAIAGALNFIGPDALYGRYWGCIEQHPCLHFEACYYQAIDYAIAHGLKKVEAGAQGPHKLARGYVPVKTRSAHWITDPGFRDAVQRYLVTERVDVDAGIELLGRYSPYRKE